MPRQQTFCFDADGYKLIGTLHLPDTPEPPLVIGCHGLLANRHSSKQISLAAACNQKGVAYFRFDHRGCGDSQGEFSEVTSLSARRQDLYHAVHTLQHYSGMGPLIGLFGSSFGGTVVLAYAANFPSPTLITYAAPVNSTAINHANIRDNSGTLPSTALLTNALKFDITSKLASIRNILIVHSKGDETVPVAHAHQIFDHAGQQKKILLFQNGDHRMSEMAHQETFKNQFIQWLIQSAK